ncbi:MAG: amidohydrolase family protein [Acidobacteria bacterium]|nr:amidohydrolase family protein [Acidobacteriota bacterium]MDA1235608.1 amidohydrolase family protein [Acidobacteriota bacterium]
MGDTTRRKFFHGSAAAAALASEAAAQTYQKPGHFTVDCQSHLFVPELVEMMMKRKEPPYAYQKDGDTYVVTGPPGEWHRRLRKSHMDVDAKLADMDEAGIDLTLISINDPGPDVFGKDGMTAARICNDWIGDLGRKHPKRFAGLIVLPLQNMNESLKELDRCVNRLGMKGILLYSNLAEKFPDEDEFRELFAEAERMDIPILLHPAHPVTFEQTKGRSLMAGLGLMFDTSIALARIIMAGILDQYPKLKLVCPHVGGTLPYLVGRLDHQALVLKRGAENITRAPSEYLRHIYLDAVSPIPMAIQYGIDFVGVDRMLYSSDHPWVDPKTIGGHLQSLGLPPADEAKIFGGNARQLFKL